MSEPRKLAVTDANSMDEKIPRNLILMYDKTPYIMKAGLEWKANKLFHKYSLELEPHTLDFEKQQFVFKATFRSGEQVFVNFGEAHAGNANSMMQKQLMHLAATRAECRVLRMATACGYASYDEVKTQNGDHPEKLVVQEDDGKPATKIQLETLKRYKIDMGPNVTRKEAREAIIDQIDARKAVK